MCDRGYYEWLRVSRYYLRRVADQDRWEAEAEAHGNEGSVPWNRLDDLCRLAIREVFEIFTYTDPAGTGEVGVGDVPNRYWNTAHVNTRWKWCVVSPAPPLLCSSRCRAGRSVLARREPGGNER